MHRYFSPIVNTAVDHIRPSFATLFSVATVGSQAAVWNGYIRDWAALITIILGVPTAALALIYWYIKVKHLLSNKDKES